MTIARDPLASTIRGDAVRPEHPDYDGPYGNPFRGLTVERLSPTKVRFVLQQPLASFLTAATQPIVPAPGTDRCSAPPPAGTSGRAPAAAPPR